MDAELRQILTDTVDRWFAERVSTADVLERVDRGWCHVERSEWAEVAALGWLGLGLPEAAGGAGVALADRTALFLHGGRSLALGEYLPWVTLAGRCLAESPEHAARFVAGERLVAAALEDAGDLPGVVAEPLGDRWRLRGVKRRVVGALSADAFVVSAGPKDQTTLFLVEAGPGVTVSAQHTIDGTRPWGELALDGAGATVLCGPERGAQVLQRAWEEALTALAFEAIGAAQEVLADATAYAGARYQFAKPIGSFQGVSGPLADAYVTLELARALADWAAVAVDEQSRPSVASAAALAAATRAARTTIERAIQVAGAIGFTWEHRYHRYLRRVLWIERFAPSAAVLHERVAEALLDSSEPVPTVELLDDEATAAFRIEVRRWISDNLPTSRRGADLMAPLADYEATKEAWRKRLVDHGGLVAHWPRVYGGRDASALETAIFREEAIRAHPRVSHGDGGSDLVAPLLMEYGTEAQRARYLEGIRLETEFWAQGFSEPDSGSDLASLSTRATPGPGGWVLNGQKVWSTYSPVASHLFVLARTDPESSRHRGITCFIVPADAPGVLIRPIRDIAGTEEFGEVFFTDVAVPDEAVLGPVGQGWSVAVMTLAIERVIESCEDIGELDFVLDRLLDGVRDPGLAGDAATDRGTRARLGALWAQLQAVRLVQYRCLVELATSPVPPPESEILKLAWSELAQQVNGLALDLFGPHEGGSARADEVARFWEFWYMMSRSVTIYAGTSEILRSVIAERILGMPRSR